MYESKPIVLGAAVFTVSSMIAGSAYAAPVTLINPSWEDDNVNIGQFVNGLATGWNPTGNVVGTQEFNPANNQGPAYPTDGVQHGVISFTGGSMSQVTSQTITAGETYTFRVDVGQVRNFNGSQATIWLFGATTGIGTPLSNVNGTAELSGIAPPGGSAAAYLLDQTVTYTAVAGDPFEGELLAIGLTNSSGTQTLFDNARLDVESNVIPEPASGAMALGGLAVLAMRRRRG